MDIEQRLQALEAHVAAELLAIREHLAGLDDLPQVYVVPFNGATWYTDGFRCIRDRWPGEFAPKRGDLPDLAPHWAIWEAITRPVVMVATVMQDEAITLAVLSNGAYVLFDWMTELQAERGCVMFHGADPKQPVVFRDGEGEVVAVQMPIYSEYPLALTDWRGLDGRPLEKPPACVTRREAKGAAAAPQGIGDTDSGSHGKKLENQ